MTKKAAVELNTSSHLDLLLIRKVIGYEQNDKVDAKVPIYQAHYVLMLDAIELATDARKNNSQTLQCLKCKQHLVGRTRESTRAMLRYHYENDECVERSIRYTILFIKFYTPTLKILYVTLLKKESYHLIEFEV